MPPRRLHSTATLPHAHEQNELLGRVEKQTLQDERGCLYTFSDSYIADDVVSELQTLKNPGRDALKKNVDDASRLRVSARNRD